MLGELVVPAATPGLSVETPSPPPPALPNSSPNPPPRMNGPNKKPRSHWG